MRKLSVTLLAAAVVGLAGILFAQTAQKDPEMAKQLAGLSQKLDTVIQNQAKLDTILANQEKMIQMLIIIRHR